METFGDRLRQLRKSRGWTLAQLAAHSGYDKSYLSALETGRRSNPSLQFMEDMVKVFDTVARDWLQSGGGGFPFFSVAMKGEVREGSPSYSYSAKKAHISKQLELGAGVAISSMTVPQLIGLLKEMAAALQNDEPKMNLAYLGNIRLACAELQQRLEPKP